MDLDHAACYRAMATRDARFDGRLFVGVTTTGIYCRPICPARTPKIGNVRFFPTAAAAQSAGFRPCLRCRPEASPDLAVWRGTSNTVTRAMALIEAGALDRAGVEALAERLGVGGRQLRRLFRQHLGATPVAVAQTRRVLLAKQLIRETNLTMTDVAIAAGFNSVRRFNEIFRSLFGRPPAALRRAATAAPGPAGSITFGLTYQPPYDWEAMLAFLRARAIPGVETVDRDRYARTIAFRGHHGVLMVEPSARHRLAVTVAFPQLGALPDIIARVRRVLDLAADPEPINAHFAGDPLLAPLVEARPGLRVPGAWDGFELAVRAVVGQQITVPAATKLLGRLALSYGEALGEAAPAAGLTHVFPTPERLAASDPGLLAMPGQRARALASLAASVVADPTMLGPRRSLEDAIAALTALPGIGEWTAQYIAMRELREPDAFPAADIGLMRAMTGPDGRRPTPAELTRHAERWRPWRAYAALHLWASGHQQATSSPENVRDQKAA